SRWIRSSDLVILFDSAVLFLALHAWRDVEPPAVLPKQQALAELRAILCEVTTADVARHDADLLRRCVGLCAGRAHDQNVIAVTVGCTTVSLDSTADLFGVIVAGFEGDVLAAQHGHRIESER